MKCIGHAVNTCLPFILVMVLICGITAQEAISPGSNSGISDQPVVTTVSRIMTYQGILKNSGGEPVPDSFFDVTFRIYNAESGGSMLWGETISVGTDANGYFTAELNGLEIPFDQDYWLELELSGEGGPMSPRGKINMSAYAARAGISESSIDIVDDAITSSKIADGSIALADLAQNGASEGQVIKWQGGNWGIANDETGAGSSGWVDDGDVVRLETQSDKVGIGTSSPIQKLHVNGRVFIEGNTIDQGLAIGSSLNTDQAAHLSWQDDLGLSIHSWGRNFGEQLFIDGNSAAVAIGTSNPIGSNELTVNGNMAVTNGSIKLDIPYYIGLGSSSPRISFNSSANIACESDFLVNGLLRVSNLPVGSGNNVNARSSDGLLQIELSSIKYKDDIRSLTNDKWKIFELNPVSFKWKASHENEIGLIAEEVARVIPDLVIFDGEGNPSGVKYDKISLYLVAAIKELKKENDNLRKRIESLENRD